MVARIHRRTARTALLYAVSGFLALLITMTAAIERFHPQLYDVEHVTRNRLLREKLSENPERPLYLALGTSRLGLALLPEKLPTYQTPDGRDVLVFNYSHLGAAPAFHWMQLHRLYAEGIRPSWVLLDLIPAQLAGRDDNFISHHVGVRDLLVLHPYVQAHKLYPRYLRRIFEETPRYPAYLAGLDPEPSFGMFDLGGYGGLVESVDAETRTRKTAVTRKLLAQMAGNFQICPRPARLMHDCIRLCQERGAKVSVIMMPEGSQLRSWYAPDSERLLQSYLGQVRVLGVPVIDARKWLDDADFSDEHHVLQRGADKFTARFAKEVLTPLLCEKPLTATAP